MGKRSGRQSARTEAPPVRADWPIAVVAAAGVLDAAYLAWLKLAGGNALFCTAGSGCDLVQGSRYAVFLGLPLGVWGVLFYVSVGALALAGLSRQRWLVAFLITAGGVAFSGYLTYLELFVIRRTCPYCVASAVISVVLLVALVLRRPVAGRRTNLRPARLAGLGLLAGAVAVVVAAGIYATPNTSENASYQETLARHLAATGAVMYGAYW